MTKVRVHVASICGSWETEPLLLEQARAYGQQLKKKQPLHSVTLRGFADGHFEEIPKQEKRKVRKHMAFREVTADIEAWAGPIEGQRLVAKKISEMVVPPKKKGREPSTFFICQLVDAYPCIPTGSDKDTEAEIHEPGTIVGVRMNALLKELLKYDTVVFAVKWREKEDIGDGQTMWKGRLAIDDETVKVKHADLPPAVANRVEQAKSKTVDDSSDDDDIPF